MASKAVLLNTVAKLCLNSWIGERGGQMQKYQFQSQFIVQEENYDILVIIIIAFLISDFNLTLLQDL